MSFFSWNFRLRLSSGHIGSQGGLVALRQGRAHLGGSHRLDPETMTYNVPYIERFLTGVPLKLINLAWREQGLMVAQGNPKNIHAIADLVRPDVRFINRQRGAGTRLRLDYLLKEHHLKAADVHGYEREEYTHMAVAVNVLSGTTDVGLGILAAAKALGLDFIPLMPERYDPVVPESTYEDLRFQTLLEVIRSPEFKEAAGDGHNGRWVRQVIRSVDWQSGGLFPCSPCRLDAPGFHVILAELTPSAI